MPLIEVPVPQLLGGVSQQPPASRVPGQLEAVDNCLLHVINGLGKRKGSRHLARLFTGVETVRATHLINRDSTERYAVLIGERRVRIFDAGTGIEVPVFTSLGLAVGRPGVPIQYLDPRRPQDQTLFQSEDFVIAVGPNWQSTVGNSITSYIAGRGPFRFGRFQSAVSVTADTVAEVGNDAAALVSDIYQAAGVFAQLNLASVFVKVTPNFACNDVELALVDTTNTVTHSARFDIASGVLSVGAVSSGVTASVIAFPDGWYRCSLQAEVGVVPTTPVGAMRRYRLQFHTNAVTPANKRVLLFGARLYNGVRAPADYIFERPDWVRALTVADFTFLLNTEKVTAMDALTSPAHPQRGYIFVRQGGLNDVRYQIILRDNNFGGGSTFSYTTPATGTTGLRTDSDIAESLKVAIDADAAFVAVRDGSVVEISPQSTARIDAVEASDSRGDRSMVGFANSIEKFTDLPLIGTADYVVKVAGDPERDADDYYVKFVPDSTGGSGLTKGRWEESLAPGIVTTLNATTMPQQLVRRQDDSVGTVTGVPFKVYFTAEPVAWDTRLVGDLTSNPNPSFIGKALQDIFLYRGRLGFLAEDAVILSEAGEIFNFFRTTVLDLLATDPIDVTAGVRDVVLFKNAASTADSLVLLSDRHQFQLLGEPTLTPATAQLAPIRAFESLTQVRPVDAGRGVIFARSDDRFSGLLELSLLQDDLSFRTDELTAQAPRYIVGKGIQLAYSSLTGFLACRAADEEILYVHQAFSDAQENRLQSALHRWIFHTDTLIRGMGFLEAELRLIVERAEGWFLETVLTDTETTEGGRPITHLDRRVSETQVTRVFDGGANKTTITLPYNIAPGATVQVVDAVSGLIVPITAQGTNTVTVSGDFSTAALFVGESFTMAATLSEPVVQDQNARGGPVPRMSRPLDVNRLYVYVSDTAFLRAEVTPDLRTASAEEFSAAGLGTGLLLEGVLSLYTGDTDFSIIGRSTEVSIVLKNATPFPSFVQSARFEILYRARATTV